LNYISTAGVLYLTNTAITKQQQKTTTQQFKAKTVSQSHNENHCFALYLKSAN